MEDPLTMVYWMNKDHMWLYYNHWKCESPKVCSARSLKRRVSFFCVTVSANTRDDTFLSQIFSHQTVLKCSQWIIADTLAAMSDVIQDNCDFPEYIHSLYPSLPVFVMVIVQLNSHA